MKEKHNPGKDKEEIKESLPGPFDGDNSGDPQEKAPGNAMVGSGVYLENLPVGGMKVGDIRSKYANQMDIAPDAHGFLDGKEVGNDVIVKEGQSLRFAHKAGEKG